MAVHFAFLVFVSVLTGAKRNALRHSYISYRLAKIKDTPRVALECGNSPTMIFKHYRELVLPSEATKWFSIRPVSSPKPLPKPSVLAEKLAA